MVKIFETIFRMENFGVMYSDIKPNNFRLLENDTYCLLDFGHAVQIPETEDQEARQDILESGYSL